MHWITFFGAIKIANISITLAGVSTGALWSSILGPILSKSKFDPTEVALGLLVILGIGIVFYEEPNAQDLREMTYFGITVTNFQLGLVIALFSSMLSASFSILNKQLVTRYPNPVQVTFWELGFAFLSICAYSVLLGNNPMDLWANTQSDWMYLPF